MPTLMVARLAFLSTALVFLSSPLAGTAEQPVVTEALTTSGQAVVGEKAPFLSGWTLDGHVFNIEKPFCDPKVRSVALVFWATWCLPCREGIERLNVAAVRLREAGVSVVLVNYGESEETVRNFFGGRDCAFPIVLDRFKISEAYYIMSDRSGGSLPRTVLICSDGIVAAIYGAEGRDYVDNVITTGELECEDVFR